MKAKIGKQKNVVLIGIVFASLIGVMSSTAMAGMEFDAGDAGKMTIDGKIQACFGMTQYLDFVDDYDKGDDADFDATRELSLKITWEADPKLKGVASFQIGEGSTGGYFGSRDAMVGGEEDGDLIIELDNLYIDFTTDFDLNLKLGSQSYSLGEIAYGSNLLYEVPAGVTVAYPISEMATVSAGWFRFADLMDDSATNTDDQADFFYGKVALDFGGFKITPWGAYANIQEDVVRNAPSHFTYAYFDYPTLIGAANPSVGDINPTDDVNAYYFGASLSFNPLDGLVVRASGTYGDMDWATADADVSIAGYFFDLVADYKMDLATPELFALYGNGPDKNNSDIDMMPVLIGGPTYTSSYFGGSRYNDNMFDSYDSTYAVSMWAVGFKLKDIKTGDKLSHEFQVMYAEGLADETILKLRMTYCSMKMRAL